MILCDERRNQKQNEKQKEKTKPTRCYWQSKLIYFLKLGEMRFLRANQETAANCRQRCLHNFTHIYTNLYIHRYICIYIYILIYKYILNVIWVNKKNNKQLSANQSKKLCIILNKKYHIKYRKQSREKKIPFDCVDRHACMYNIWTMRVYVCNDIHTQLIIATNSNITRAYELGMTMFDYVHIVTV